MSKTKRLHKKNTRFLVELDHGRKILLLKRGRLLRTGEFIEVQKLNDFPRPARPWLRAVVSQEDKTTSLWDQAHSLAARIKNDLGELVYVEPEISSGQTGLYRALISVYGSAAPDKGENDEDNSDSNESFSSDFDPRSLIPDPMKHIKAGMPDASLLPSIGQTPSRSMGNTGEAPMLPSMESNGGARKNTKRKVHDTRTIAERLEGHFSRRFNFPLLYSLPAWHTLPKSTQRMLEIEMVQVYRGAQLRAKYPMLESDLALSLSQEEKTQILEQLFALPMSKALRRLNKEEQLAA